MRQGCMSVLRAVLAALSARSLPRMPTWPGSQQRWISKPDALSDGSLGMISSIMGWSMLRWSSACRHDMESVKIPIPIGSVRCTRERAVSSFGRENGTVILNAMTVAMINEDCCYRDPLGVFRTVSVEWNVSWESGLNLCFRDYTPLNNSLSPTSASSGNYTDSSWLESDSHVLVLF